MLRACSAAVRRANPAIVDLECAGIGFRPDHDLNAIGIWVTASTGKGIRTWIGADAAPSAALRFCAATVRLVEGIAT